ARERGSGITALDVARAAQHGDQKQRRKAALRIGRLFASLNRTLGVNVRSTASQFVPLLCSRLDLPQEVEAKAITLVKLVQLNGGSPKVAATGSVYMAAILTGRRIGQRAVADAASVSEVSVRKIGNLLKQNQQVGEELNRG